jgi:chromosome segregation ATPase
MMTKRDLLRDLEIAKKATPGPWYDYGRYGDENPCGHEVTIKGDIHHVIAEEVSANNARFITEAREGWPEAIERALKAEAEVESLRKQLNWHVDTANDTIESLWKENEKLKVEVERLRAELERHVELLESASEVIAGVEATDRSYNLGISAAYRTAANNLRRILDGEVE